MHSMCAGRRDVDSEQKIHMGGVAGNRTPLGRKGWIMGSFNAGQWGFELMQ